MPVLRQCSKAPTFDPSLSDQILCLSCCSLSVLKTTPQQEHHLLITLGFNSNLRSEVSSWGFCSDLTIKSKKPFKTALPRVTSVSPGALTQLVVGLCDCGPAHQHLALHLQPCTPSAVTNLALWGISPQWILA